MYEYRYTPKTSGPSQTHQLLFDKEQFNDFNPNPDNSIVGSGIFYNSTRSQIKDITEKNPTC